MPNFGQGMMYPGGSNTFRENVGPNVDAPPQGGYQRQEPPAYGGPASPGMSPDFIQMLLQIQQAQRGGGGAVQQPMPLAPAQADGMARPSAGGMPGGLSSGGMPAMGGGMGAGLSPQLMQMFQLFQNPQMAQFFRQLFGGGGGPQMGGAPGMAPPGSPGAGGMARPNTAPSTLPGTQYQGPPGNYAPPAPQPPGGARNIGGANWMNTLFPGGGPNQPAGGSPVTGMGNASSVSFSPLGNPMPNRP